MEGIASTLLDRQGFQGGVVKERGGDGSVAASSSRLTGVGCAHQIADTRHFNLDCKVEESHSLFSSSHQI